MQSLCRHVFVQRAGDELREGGEHEVEEDQVPLIDHGRPGEPAVELIPEDQRHEHLGTKHNGGKSIIHFILVYVFIATLNLKPRHLEMGFSLKRKIYNTNNLQITYNINVKQLILYILI